MGRQGCRRWAGVQDVPLAKHEQKQSTALFAAQGLAFLRKVRHRLRKGI
ncbi:hypothetical protein [Acinetobacter guillouiae]|nr:hypothetical protein L291_0114 [Acinetobacter guillouiae MSP4-18]MBK5646426.1 hypothetical protein [Acinetobacter sp.]MDN5491227.1 hypothetical protein [Acinetobacter sp.]